MPAQRRGRKAAEDDEEPDNNGSDQDTNDEGDELEEQVQEETGSDVTVRVAGDYVAIEIPRDGNEKQTLTAIADLVGKMS